MNSKFLLGKVVMTSGIASEIEHNPKFSNFVKTALGKYSRCDWGDTCKEDAEMNDLSIRGVTEGRLLAVYDFPDDGNLTIWIITEWDHSCTTILFPWEY